MFTEPPAKNIPWTLTYCSRRMHKVAYKVQQWHYQGFGPISGDLEEAAETKWVMDRVS